MNTKHNLTLCLLVLGLTISEFSLANSSAKRGEDKPNIIFIIADDLGYGEVGFNGQQKINTPNLDRMAKDGVIFTSFYAGAPVCGPSRASLLYGQHTGHVPIRANPRWTQSGKAVEMKLNDIILPKVLKKAGYATAHFGKWGLNENLENDTGNPLKQGFDEFVGFNTHREAHYHWPDYIWQGNKKDNLSRGIKRGNYLNRYKYADDYFTEKALEYIDRQVNKAPFFMYLSYTIPHKGYTSPKESRALYENKNWQKKSPPKSKHYEYDYSANSDINASFAGMISHMDGYIAQIRDKLEQLDIADNTLIVFTSDNGSEFQGDFFNSSAQYTGGKRSLTEGGIRMPTFIYWPKVVKAGTVINEPFAFWDVLPTFADIVDVPHNSQTDGLSFYPALRGQFDKQIRHKYLYWEYNESKGPMQAVRKDNWKAIRYWNKKQSRFNALQLFNLDNDAGEQNDIAKKHPKVTGNLLNIMLSARTEHPEFPLNLRNKKTLKYISK